MTPSDRAKLRAEMQGPVKAKVPTRPKTALDRLGGGGMIWTNNAPTIPGWYWLREAKRPPEVVHVCWSNGTLFLWRNGTGEDWELSEFVRLIDAVEWCGLLEPPA